MKSKPSQLPATQELKLCGVPAGKNILDLEQPHSRVQAEGHKLLPVLPEAQEHSERAWSSPWAVTRGGQVAVSCIPALLLRVVRS